MKSKLTLRLDEDLKEAAKQLARNRGVSVSRLVEDYFRILLRERPNEDPEADRAPGSEEENERFLTPRIRELKESLGKPAPEVHMDDDTRAWIDAAAQKHE